ncbi:MAG: hypothetical protein WAN44_01725 [Propionibacteriaceae bacterium]
MAVRTSPGWDARGRGILDGTGLEEITWCGSTVKGHATRRPSF